MSGRKAPNPPPVDDRRPPPPPAPPAKVNWKREHAMAITGGYVVTERDKLRESVRGYVFLLDAHTGDGNMLLARATVSDLAVTLRRVMEQLR